ncbi:MFS transporter [Cellulomonas sp. P22]|uniref:MFS transporter n=1 Tax=Cellulomonas sp. P22 TaxID=3373189 RepID=UPI003792CD7F
MTSSAAAPDEPDPRRWRALWVCLAVGFITLLDVSIVNVALPSIDEALGASSSQLQLVVAGYTLAFGLALVPAGRYGDARGRRTVMLVGLVLFALTSLGSGLAPTGGVLAGMRLLQGLSAGMLNPQVTGFIQELFRGPERARAFGTFGATVGVSLAIGPLLGGAIIQAAGTESGWRWVFFVNVPVIALVLPFAWRWLPRAAHPRGTAHFDHVGLLLIALTTVALMLPLVTTTGVGDDPARWWWLLVAAVLGTATVLWERRFQRRTGAAVLDPDVLGQPSFRNGALLGLAYFAGFTSVFLVITLYLQTVLHFTALQAGLVSTPFAVASAVSSKLAGRLVVARGRRLVVVGLVLVLVGLAGTYVVVRQLDAPGVGWAVAATQLVTGAGSGLVIAPNQTLTLERVPVGSAGVAGSMLQLGQRVGSALGVAVNVAVFYATLAAGGSGALAVDRALRVTSALVLAALVVALVDLRTRSAQASPKAGRAGSATA